MLSMPADFRLAAPALVMTTAKFFHPEIFLAVEVDLPAFLESIFGSFDGHFHGDRFADFLACIDRHLRPVGGRRESARLLLSAPSAHGPMAEQCIGQFGLWIGQRGRRRSRR